jgi:murein DD-endopeptidase MepM/ murein hydrolase activator NlpD
MKDLVQGTSKISASVLTLLVVLALLIPIAVIGGAGAVVMGAAVGIGAALDEGPANCKAPPNLFDAWETLRDFVTGVNCSDECGLGGGVVGDVEANTAEYVKTIIGTGTAMGVPEKGQIIALTTALVESNLKNYANDGVYDTSRNPADATLADARTILGFISKSTGFPHDAVGSDATSVGLFQQQAWWGAIGKSTWQTDPQNTITRLMDPVFQSQKFYDRLLGIKNWQQMDYGVAAQTVQVSAFPGAYNKRVEEAKGLYAKYKGEPAQVQLYDLGKQYGELDGEGEGSACGGTGLVLDKNSLYQVTGQFAYPPSAIRQGRTHAGMDFDCGEQFENVYAPIDGVVVIAINGNSSGFGTPMGAVSLKTGDGSILRFYHLRNTFVTPGSTVTAGTAVGECASTGNSTGTHLHVEIDVSGSTNAALIALPREPKIGPGFRDPALALEILGVDICPPYTANRKSAAVGAPLPSKYLKCWPPEEWVR